MAVEVATFIEQLNAAWPATNDEIPEGDDHIRLTKGTLQTQFPNLGIVAPVNPTAEELNFMVGVTLGVQFQLDALSVRIDGNDTELSDHEDRITALEDNPLLESGTLVLFPQAAAPTGWTLVVANDDRAIINRSSAGGGTGGSWTITGVTVDGHVLTAAQLGAHTHTGPSHAHAAGTLGIPLRNAGSGSSIIAAGTSGNATGSDAVTGSTAAAGTGVTGSAGSNSSHAHGVTADAAWRPLYLDVITCSKDV